MTASRWLVVVVIGVVIVAGVVGLSHLATAQEAGPGPAAATTMPPTETTGAPAEPPPPVVLLPETNPIVSVVVSVSETEYEEDPFEPSQLRSATTRVRTLLYIRADGSVETKQVG